MARIKPQTVPFRRKREQRTNYKKRLHLLFSQKPRLAVRVTNTRIIAQIISFRPTGDIVTLGVDSLKLRTLGWAYSCQNLPAAYLTGLLIGKEALAKGVKEVILDTGVFVPHRNGRIYSFLKGAVDAGLRVPHSKEGIFPSVERISGKHIQDYAAHLKAGKNLAPYERHFAQYLKSKVDPQQITAQFEAVKKKIMH